MDAVQYDFGRFICRAVDAVGLACLPLLSLWKMALKKVTLGSFPGDPNWQNTNGFF